MVVLQCLNKIINTNKADLIIDNNLTREMFIGYENEFDYIINHYNKYHNIPDKETFLSEFPEFDLLEVQESDKYLLDKLNEEWLYYKTVPVIHGIKIVYKFVFIMSCIKIKCVPAYHWSRICSIHCCTDWINHHFSPFS